MRNKYDTGPSHFWYEGRNVAHGGQRAEKIRRWEVKQASKRIRRAARRAA